ncbi:MAG: hypothetical protein JST00_13420 [Deltaproteobacteria bacterium]|nr:hypothetical protein [Deltaproteobacteria bacterium]
MRGRIAAVSIAAATMGWLVACGGTSETDPSPDAGLPGEEAGTEDSGPDVVDTDAGTDGASDAKPDRANDASAGYCATLSPKPKFCDDFDDGDVANDWLFKNVLGGSVLDLDVSSATSAPYSMGIVTPPLTNMQQGPAHLRQTLFGNAKHQKLSFSTYFVTSPTITKGTLAIATLDVSTDHFFTLYLRDSPTDGVSTPAAVLEEIQGATTNRFPLASLPPMGAWARITLDVDLVAGKASVLIGSTKAVDDVTIGTTGGTEATFRLGAVYLFGPADPVEARFDDVVVDY